MAIYQSNKSTKKHKRGKVIFDDEVVTKDVATQLIEENKSSNVSTKLKKRKKNINSEDMKSSELINEANEFTLKKKQRKHSKKKHIDGNSELTVDSQDKNPSKEKQSNVADIENNTEPEIADNSEVLQPDNLNNKKEESIRAKKRRRHLELLQEKKLRGELNLQQKCLNYLSMWKHSRVQWKFEKLKQIWLLQNMFDDVKVPDEFWDTLLEYFDNAKGQVKSNILREAVKIMENVQKTEEDSLETPNVKYVRARNIVQILQE